MHPKESMHKIDGQKKKVVQCWRLGAGLMLNEIMSIITQ
jgi:hypothetical protein